MNTNTQQPPNRSRESTPEHDVIPSQYRLQQILEMENPFEHVPVHILADYQSRGLILVTDEGEICLATPMKPKKSH